MNITQTKYKMILFTFVFAYLNMKNVSEMSKNKRYVLF